MSVEDRIWHPGSWRDHEAAQQPDWDDAGAVDAVRAELSQLPGLVRSSEVDTLRTALASAASGRAFVLQAGDCAERFADCTEPAVRGKLQVILQMAVLLSYGAGLPVVKLGRIAGQYGKPRSQNVEIVDGVELPVFRGDIVNAPEFTAASRRADPGRMRRGYQHARDTIDLLRGIARSGFAAPEQIHEPTLEFVRNAPVTPRYRHVAEEVARALSFSAACRADHALTHHLGAVPRGAEAPPRPSSLFTSHEALLLPFEEALARTDTRSGRWYALSAHQLWIGERTRDPDGAHVEFLSGVANPVGIKLGPGTRPYDLLRLCEQLNPDGVPGRLTLIPRMGADLVVERLIPLVEAIAVEGRTPLWMCDPMHGNTVRAGDGHKTRRLTDVVAEIEGFFAVHRLFGTHPGGLHLELTGTDVTECVGGRVAESDLGARYETACDPRLNAEQAIELAFRVADLLRDHDTRAAAAA